MHIIHAEIPDYDFQLFHRPGLDLTTAQLVELDTEHPCQLDLFAPLPSGERLPVGMILETIANRYRAAYRQTGDPEDRNREQVFNRLAKEVRG
ncbi:hypothetical protein D9M71_728000 [compost metagenome]